MLYAVFEWRGGGGRVPSPTPYWMTLAPHTLWRPLKNPLLSMNEERHRVVRLFGLWVKIARLHSTLKYGKNDPKEFRAIRKTQNSSSRSLTSDKKTRLWKYRHTKECYRKTWLFFCLVSVMSLSVPILDNFLFCNGTNKWLLLRSIKEREPRQSGSTVCSCQAMTQWETKVWRAWQSFKETYF